MTTQHESCGVLRSILKEEFSFADIKVIAGLAGVDPTTLAHLEQKSGTGGATKSQLLSAIDQELGRMDESRRQRFHRIASAEAVKRKPIVEAKLHDAFERLKESSRLERNSQPFRAQRGEPDATDLLELCCAPCDRAREQHYRSANQNNAKRIRCGHSATATGIPGACLFGQLPYHA